MTKTIREHLLKYHHKEFVQGVTSLRLKGRETVEQRSSAVNVTENRKTFDNQNHAQSVERLHELLVRWTTVDDQVRHDVNLIIS